MPDTDTADIEAIQARIDLSMAFANDLVSSWMANPGSSAASSSKSAEAELKEIMRRPPRLGVGAKVSEAAISASRETARLKNQLHSKKRPREELDDQKKSAMDVDADDEDESRSVAIHKKQRPDPFSKQTPAPPAASAIHEGKRKKKKKKKKHDNNGESGAQGPSQQAVTVTVKDDNAESTAHEPSPPPSPPQQPSAIVNMEKKNGIPAVLHSPETSPHGPMPQAAHPGVIGNVKKKKKRRHKKNKHHLGNNISL